MRDPELSNIPVILLSSKDQDTDKVWGLRQGATDYLVKPLTESRLREAVSRLNKRSATC